MTTTNFKKQTNRNNPKSNDVKKALIVAYSVLFRCLVGLRKWFRASALRSLSTLLLIAENSMEKEPDFSAL